MSHRSLILWFLLTGLFAVVGSYSYFYMERMLKEIVGYQPRFLKYPTDLWEVYSQYRGLTLRSKAPHWASRAFAFSVGGIVLSIIYVLLAPRPFG